MKLTLVQKVIISVLVVSTIASVLVAILIAVEIKNVYLTEQKRNVAEFVQKQAEQHLRPGDFKVENISQTGKTFDAYKSEILTSEIVRVKIYDTSGVVLYSDEKQLIGQKLFQGEEDELEEILKGEVVADIAKPTKQENVFEKQFGELMEIYTPIYFGGDRVVGIVETYYQLDLLNALIIKSQVYLISSILTIFIVLLVVLFFLINKASKSLFKYSIMKDEFITLASHQLRTPASSLKWNLELLTDGIAKLLTTPQQEALDAIKNDNENLISIVDNMLIVSDIKPDYFTYEDKDYDPHGVISEVIKKNEAKIRSKKLDLKLNLTKEANSLVIRSQAFLLIVKSIIENAIDYSKPQGKIVIEYSQKNNKHFQFIVKDEGIGIPLEEQANVFGKFFRAKNSIVGKNVGSGLSLYLVKEIVSGYGGKITFVSDTGGTEFKIVI